MPCMLGFPVTLHHTHTKLNVQACVYHTKQFKTKCTLTLQPPKTLYDLLRILLFSLCW